MRFLRVYRVNGDSISCRFAADGSLSTAMFIFGGSQRNAAQQLPGLNASNAKEFLADIGYFEQYDDESRKVARSVNEKLVEHNLLIETLRPSNGRVLVSVVDLRAACFICPARLFVGLWDRKKDVFEPVHVNDKQALATFRCVVGFK